MAVNLRRKVLNRVSELGVKESARLFGVSTGTISNWASGKTSPSIDALELVWDEAGQPQVHEQLVTWEGKEVLILQPIYRSFNPRTHFTLFANYAKYGPERIGLEMRTRTVIHESRNILIDRFMKHPTAKRAVFVDDDMILPFGNAAVVNVKYRARLPDDLASQVALSRILSHGSDKGIVGALYFGRQENGYAQCASAFTSLPENTKLHNLEYRGLKAEDWVATGFMKIERWVIEKMKAEIDGGRWPECKPSKEDSWYGYFNPMRVRMGEDVSFGRRAGEVGIQSYVDTSLVCGHADGNYIYWAWNTKAQPPLR